MCAVSRPRRLHCMLCIESIAIHLPAAQRCTRALSLLLCCGAASGALTAGCCCEPAAAAACDRSVWRACAVCCRGCACVLMQPCQCCLACAIGQVLASAHPGMAAGRNQAIIRASPPQAVRHLLVRGCSNRHRMQFAFDCLHVEQFVAECWRLARRS